MIFARPARFSPSLKLVLKILQSNGWMTQKEIIFETTLPPRTTRYALKKLKDAKVIQERLNLSDMRMKSFRYTGTQKSAFLGGGDGK